MSFLYRSGRPFTRLSFRYNSTASRLSDSVITHQESNQETTEHYLNALSQSIAQPTLEDLERHRPKHLPPAESHSYNQVYNETIEHLSKSFTKQQLLSFEQLLGRGYARRRSKRLVLENVMEHGLSIPSPSSIERTRREQTEITTVCALASPFIIT